MMERLEVRRFRTPDDYHACVELQRDTWGEGFSELVPRAILMAANRVGGVAAGAFEPDGRLVGFVFGISGIEEGRLVHWSDMLAVRPDLRDRGLGERLKRYQRDLLLPLGVERVYWTFDPLEAKNAYFNFSRLGALAWEYRRDLYGETDSPLHRGIGTDRLVAVWEIASERVRRRLSGDDPPVAPDAAADLPLVNDTRETEAGIASAAPRLDLDAPRLRVAIPPDIQVLKTRDPECAADWRTKTRAALEHYLGRAYRVEAVVREEGRVCYVLGVRD